MALPCLQSNKNKSQLARGNVQILSRRGGGKQQLQKQDERSKLNVWQFFRAIKIQLYQCEAAFPAGAQTSKGRGREPRDSTQEGRLGKLSGKQRVRKRGSKELYCRFLQDLAVIHSLTCHVQLGHTEHGWTSEGLLGGWSHLWRQVGPGSFRRVISDIIQKVWTNCVDSLDRLWIVTAAVECLKWPLICGSEWFCIASTHPQPEHLHNKGRSVRGLLANERQGPFFQIMLQNLLPGRSSMVVNQSKRLRQSWKWKMTPQNWQELEDEGMETKLSACYKAKKVK